MGLWAILSFWLQGVTPLRLTALSYWDFIFFYLQPVKAKVRLLSGEELLENGGMLQQVVQLSHLQKLLVCFIFNFVVCTMSSSQQASSLCWYME